MEAINFPVIDLEATGRNILRLRKERGLSVRDIQSWFGFEEPQAIYKWQHGQSLPTVDNLFALSSLLGVSMNEILVSRGEPFGWEMTGQQAESCCSDFFALIGCFRYGRSPGSRPPIAPAPLSPSSPWGSGERSAAERDPSHGSIVGTACPDRVGLKPTIFLVEA